MCKISASILSANWLELGNEIKRVESAGCDCIHIDITDGHFVSNITMGFDIAKAVSDFSVLRKDAHLMISNPEKYIGDVSDTGVDSIIFHAEATAHPFEMIELIKKRGKLAGVALDPATPVESIDHYVNKLDIVLLVAVCVGYGGQSYIEEVDNKINTLKRLRKKNNLEFEIQIDGGITKENARRKIELGVDNLVAGSMIFKCPNIPGLIKFIK